MKTARKFGIEPDGEADVEVLVLYDDIIIGKQAKGLCDCLAEELGEKCKLQASFWSFKVLYIPQVLQAVAESARTATFIVIAVDGHKQLPFGVKTLVSMFSYGKARAEGALVALLRMPPGYGEDVCPAYAYLKDAVNGAGLAFFSEIIELDRNDLYPETQTEEPRMAEWRGIHPKSIEDARQIGGASFTRFS
jgi:hypothetical protein